MSVSPPTDEVLRVPGFPIIFTHPLTIPSPHAFGRMIVDGTDYALYPVVTMLVVTIGVMVRARRGPGMSFTGPLVGKSASW